MNQNKLLYEWFEHSAIKYPNHTALQFGSKCFSYKEINNHANILSQLIREHDPNKTSKLGGIVCHRSVEAYIGMLGLLKANKGYVPFNKNFPDSRNQMILNQSKVRILIVDNNSQSLAEKLLEDQYLSMLVVMLNFKNIPIWTKRLNQHVFVTNTKTNFDQVKKKTKKSLNNIAYLLFTSGTTGRAKGVKISHKNVCSFITEFNKKYSFTNEDKVFHSSDLTFDWSIPEIWVAWSSGACVCVVPEFERMAPVNYAVKNKITIWFSVPSTIRVMKKLRLLVKDKLSLIKISFFCGEALLGSDVLNWKICASKSQIINMYGPTETTVSVTAYDCNFDDVETHLVNNIVPIGKAFGSQIVGLFDNELNPVANGEIGEILISGEQVSPGYLNNYQLSNEKFVILKWKNTNNRWYRTGDLGMYSNHKLHFVGRKDDQVQVMGYRVELSEIEALIGKITESTSAVAVGWPMIDEQVSGIIVFVVTEKIIDEEKIIKKCSKELPPYMVPKEIHSLSGMPLNSSGKIDRNKLIEIRRSFDTNE